MKRIQKRIGKRNQRLEDNNTHQLQSKTNKERNNKTKTNHYFQSTTIIKKSNYWILLYKKDGLFWNKNHVKLSQKNDKNK